MKNWQKHSICVVCGLAVGALAMWLCNRCSHEEIEPIVIHDSIDIHDTTYLAGKTRVLSVRDTIYLTKIDTEYHIVDTTEMLVYATKEYCDTFATDTSSIELAVAFSGYNAKIDSVGLDFTFVVQPRVIDKKKGWRFFVGPAIQVGYGAGLNGNQVIASPYVGVGVSLGWGYTFTK